MTPVPSEREPRLVPSRLRRPAALVALCCTAVLVVLAVRYHGDRTAGRLDGWVFWHIPRAVWTHEAVLSAVAGALPLVMFLAAAALAIVSGVRRRWNLTALAVLAPSLTIAVTEAGKQLVDRRLGSYLALPSGHTAGATSVFLVLGLALLRHARRNLQTAAALVSAAVTVGGALVGLLMVSLHDHYATDTVAGFCLAVAVTLAMALAIDGIGSRWAQRRRPSPGRPARFTRTTGTGPISATNGRAVRSPR